MNDERGADRDGATIDKRKRSNWQSIPEVLGLVFALSETPGG
jgi:hypothetical protein